MPKIPTYTAGEGNGAGRGPRYSGGDAQASAIAAAGQEANQLVQTAASVFGKLQAQADERVALERLAIFNDREHAARSRLFQADPNDPNAIIPDIKDAQNQYEEDMRRLMEDMRAGLTPGALRALNPGLVKHASQGAINAREEIGKRAAIAEKTEAVKLGRTYARLALENDEDVDVRQFYESQYKDYLTRSAKRGTIAPDEADKLLHAYNIEVMTGKIDQLIEDPEGREEFFRRDEAGEFAILGQEKLGEKRRHAGVLVREEESTARTRHEYILKKQNEAVRIDIGNQVAAGRIELATVRLNIAIDKRHLTDPQTIEYLRKSIADGPLEPASNRAVLAVYQLDAETINPKMQLEDVDRAYAQFMQTGIGLNLKDATTIKNKLQQLAILRNNKANEQLVREHGQAEELLRAAINIPKGIVLTALGDDPRVRVYYGLLGQLTARSPLFNSDSKESVLKVATELGDQARKNLGSMAQLKLSEIPAVYKTPEALEQANKQGLIDPSSYEAQKRIWIHEMDPQMRQEMIEYYQRKGMDPSYTSPTDPDQSQSGTPRSSGRAKSGTVSK